MSDPLAFTEAQCAQAVDSGRPVREILEDLGMVESTWSGQPLADRDHAATNTEGRGVVLVRDVSAIGQYGDNANSKNTPNKKDGETK